jgi:acyl-CoA thioester hydrolase
MEHEKEIEIRWADLDAFGHVHHVVFLTYLEEVRDEWLGRALGDPAGVWGYVVARLEVDFRRELTLDDDTVVTREAILTRAGETAAEGRAVIVARDEETGRSRPLTDAERAAFERARA